MCIILFFHCLTMLQRTKKSSRSSAPPLFFKGSASIVRAPYFTPFPPVSATISEPARIQKSEILNTTALKGAHFTPRLK